jgi:BTB/POZ domain
MTSSYDLPNRLRHINSNEEPPASKEKANDYLLWRHEEEDSLSDWTIHVRSTQPSTAAAVGLAATTAAGSAAKPHEQGHQANNAVVKTYHVHKYVLATGPRRSEYFVRLFRHGFAESHNSTSRIELDEIAAKAFPVLLDFL